MSCFVLEKHEIIFLVLILANAKKKLYVISLQI